MYRNFTFIVYVWVATAFFMSFNAYSSEKEQAGLVTDDLRKKAEEILKQKTINVVFEENLGQWDSHILFQATGAHGIFSILKDGISITTFQSLSADEHKELIRIKEYSKNGNKPKLPQNGDPKGMQEYFDSQGEYYAEKFQNLGDGFPLNEKEKELLKKSERGWVWNYKFKNINLDCKISKKDLIQNKGVKNYLLGDKTINNIPSFKEIRFENIYPGIDLRIYGDGKGGLEYDFIVYPKADPSDISIVLEGTNGISIAKDGSISAGTGLGALKLPAPYSYQIIDGKECKVDIEFRKKAENSIGLSLARGKNYERNEILIIDPMILEYACIWGDRITSVLPLADGSCLVTGMAAGTNVTTTPGAFSSNLSGSFVSKFSPTGTLVWSTGIPGFTQSPWDILLMPDNSILVMGNHYLNSPSLPTTPGALYPTSSGSNEMGLVAIAPDGQSVIWGTYFPLTRSWIHLHTDGSLYLVSQYVVNSDLPVTAGCQPYLAYSNPFPYGSNYNSYIARISNNGQNLLWGTYIGGNKSDNFDSFQVLSDGAVVFKGYTLSNALPVTPDAGQKTFGGENDLFVGMIEGSNGNTRWLTYLGGYSYDIQDGFNSFDISANEQILATGMRTFSDGYPLTSNAFDVTNEGQMDYGITLINMNNGSFILSSYLGGSDFDELEYVKSLPDGNFLYIGNSGSYDFPLTQDAYQPVYNGTSGWGDNTLSIISPSGQLLYSTFYGGPFGNWVEGEMLDYDGVVKRYPILGYDNNVWIAGTVPGYSPGNTPPAFPTTPGTAFQNQTSGGYMYAFNWQNKSFPVSTFIPINYAGDTPEKHSIRQLADSTVVVLGHTTTGKYNIKPTSDAIQESGKGARDLYIGRFSKTGKLLYSTLLGGSGDENFNNTSLRYITVTDSALYGFQYNTSIGPEGINRPITEGTPSISSSPYNAWFFKFKWNAWYEKKDTTIPANQLVCNMSNTIEPLTGTANHVLKLFRGISVETVNVSPPEIQWQFSLDSVQWHNIAGANGKTYQPQASALTTWYRRIILDNGKITMISRPAKVEVSLLLSPVVDPGGNYFLCPGSVTNLGGSPTASGGVPPYTYLWSPASYLSGTTIPNPQVIAVSGVTGYTIVVTDNNGCKQTEQASVQVIYADAGEDRNICSGSSVVLTAPGYPGSTNLNYHWTATGGSGNASITSPNSASTLVNPTLTTTYTVTIDDGGLSGGTCPSDNITVNTVVAPVADAGSDLFICEGDDTWINGNATPWTGNEIPTWTPGSNINSVSQWSTLYDGSFPHHKPPYYRKYILTVYRGDAICPPSHDTVQVNIGFAAAGPDGCGPRRIGTPDITMGMMQYTWDLPYGGDTASILGQEHLAMPIVNPNKPTTYQLTTNLNGAICVDYVTVGICGCPVPYSDKIIIPVECSTTLQKLPFKLQPWNIDTLNYNYEWSGGNLSVLDNPYTAYPNVIFPITTNQNYTVTARSKFYPNVSCSGTINVITAFGSPPVAVVAENPVICPGTSLPVHIGAPMVAGLNYKWTPKDGINFDDIANPIAFPDSSTIYMLIVEDKISLCRDTNFVEVIVRKPMANGGGDRYFCSAGEFMLGTPAQPNHSYLWQPSQYLDDSVAAQPVATIYTGGISIFLTATDTLTGCIAKDTVTFFEAIPFVADAGVNKTKCITQDSIVLGTSDLRSSGAVYKWVPTTGLDDPYSPNPKANPEETTTYTLYVGDHQFQGCESSDDITVFVQPTNTSTIDAGPDLYKCSATAIAIGPSTLPGIVYSWSPAIGLSNPNVANPTVTTTTTRKYTLTATDTVNCTIATDDVNVFIVIPHTSTSYANLCSPGSVLIGYPEIPGATYSWVSGGGLLSSNTVAQPTVTVAGLLVGSLNYTVNINLYGCAYQEYWQIASTYRPDINAGPDRDVCNAGVVIGPSGGSYYYQWTPAVGLSCSNCSQPTAFPMDTTTYVVKVDYYYGHCSAYDTVVVRPAFQYTAGSDVIICPGDSVTIGTASQLGLTYSWTPTTGLSNPNISNPNASPSATTNYTLTVSNGSCSRTDQVKVTVKTPPSIHIVNPGTICSGTCIQLSLTPPYSAADGIVNIQWTPSEWMQDATVRSPIMCAQGDTIVSVRALHLPSGCPLRDSIYIAVSPIPAPIANAGPDRTLCIGTETQIGTTSEPGLFYEWTFLGNSFPGSALPSPLVTPTETGTYYLKITNPLNNCYSYDDVNISLQDIKVYSDFYNENCLEPYQVEYDNDWSFEGTNNYRVDWFPETGVSDPHSISPILSPNNSTTYIITVTDTITGCKAEGYGKINILSGNPPMQDPGPGIIICHNNNAIDSIQIGVPQINGYVYEWWGWAANSYLSNSNISNPYLYFYNYNTDYNLYLNITDTSNKHNTCNYKDFLYYVQIVNPITVSCPPVAMCFGDTIQLNPSVNNPDDIPLAYQWIPSSGLSSNSVLNPSCYTNTTRTYLLNTKIIADPPNMALVGCSMNTLTKVSVDPLPVIPPTSIYIACGLENERKIKLLSSPTFAYHWEPSALVSNPNISNPSFIGSVSAVLSLRVTDTKGCENTFLVNCQVGDTTDPVISCPQPVSMDASAGLCTAVPVIPMPVMTDNCSGTITLSYSTSGAMTLTGNGSINGTTFPLGTTTVLYTVTDPAGNSSSCSFTVTVFDNELPTISCSSDRYANTDPGLCTAYIGDLAPTTNDNCANTTSLSWALSGATTASGTTALNYFTFNKGITTVTFTVKDGNNNTAKCSYLVLVFDNQAPTISCPANVSVNAGAGVCFANVNLGNPVVSDLCGTGLVIVTNNAPSTFPVGTTTVTWTATDPAGNIATCQQLVTVTDNQAPTIVCPATVSVSAGAGVCFANVTLGTPVVNDNCGTANLILTNNAPASYPVGSTTVTWIVTDASGKSASCNQIVIVNDNQVPAITCPSNVSVSAGAGVCFANVDLGTPSINENCSGAVVSNNAPSTFPVGTTTVTWVVTAANGASASCEQVVVVTDTQAPSIICPDNVSMSLAAGACFATLNPTAPLTSDNCGVASVTNNAPASYPVGVTTITWVVTDIHGISASCQQTITVSDDIAPAITCPADLSVSAGVGVCFALVDPGSPLIGESCAGIVVTNDAPVQYPVGITTITWTVTDAFGNSATCIQTVTVVDYENPIISAPGNISLTTEPGLCQASATELGTPLTSDNCEVESVINNAPTVYPLGNTTLTWTVTDIHGNSATATQLITVTDNQPPLITCPNDMSFAVENGQCSFSNAGIGMASATDNCSISGISSDAPATFPVGTTTVTWIAIDESGNTASCQQIITVTDNNLPTISCPADVVTTADAGLCSASGVIIGEAVASDICGTVTLANDAPVTYPVGTTTVTWVATDNSGNTAFCTQLVTVTDIEPPTIVCPDSITIEAMQSVLMPPPVTADNCGVASVINSFNGTSNASGSYPPGITTVTWTVTDIHGNTAFCNTQVNVLGEIFAYNDTTMAGSGGTTNIIIVTNDSAYGEPVPCTNITILTQPLHGTATVNTLTGEVIYTAAIGFYGTDSLYYRICCFPELPSGEICDEAWVFFTVVQPPSACITGNTTLCLGGAATLMVELNGTPPFSFVLSNGSTTMNYDGIMSSLYPVTVYPTASTTYTLLSVTDATTLTVQSNCSVTVTLSITPLFVVAGGGNYCPGSPGSLVGLSGSKPGVWYQLMRDNVPTGAPMMGTGMPLNFGYQMASGIYTVEANDGNCTRTMASAASISPWPAPLAYTVTGGGECCLGCVDLHVLLSGSEQGVYYSLWLNGNTLIGTMWGNGAELDFGFMVNQGTYTITGVNAHGCTTQMTGMVSVLFYPRANAQIVSPDVAICLGQSTQLTINLPSGTPPFSVTLFDGTSSSIYNNVMASPLVVTVSPNATSTYTVPFVTDQHNCGNIGTGSTTVTVDTCSPVASITGKLAYDNSAATPLNNVTINLKQGAATMSSTSTDSNGDYTFSNISPGSYTLVPLINKAWGGVNATDALIIMRHFTQFINLQGVHLGAADVNASSSINSTDALVTARRFVGMINAFPAGDWISEKPAINLSTGVNNVNIKANCFGDVNGSYTPQSVKVPSMVEILSEGVMYCNKQEVVSIPVILKSAMEAGALSLVLSYPSDKAEILGVEMAGNSDKPVLFRAEGDELRIAWYDKDGADFGANETLLKITLRLLDNKQADGMYFQAQSGSEMADAAGITGFTELSMPKLAEASDKVEVSVYPNPFNAKTTFLIYNNEECHYELRIFDMLGHEVMINESREMLPAGSNSFVFDAETLPQGVYQYRLMIKSQSGDQLRTGKLVLER